MTTEGGLLFLVFVALCLMAPVAWRTRKDQKLLFEQRKKQQEQLDKLAAEQQDKVSLKAAEQIQEQLQKQLDRNHEMVIKLETELSNRDDQMLSMRRDMQTERAAKDKEIATLRSELDGLRLEVATLKERNQRLAALLRRLMAQLERHEIAPEVDVQQLNQLLA